MDPKTVSETINWPSVELAFGSSVITVIVAQFFQFFFNNINYKRDYYKTIVNKRINAYETILNKISELTAGSFNNSDKKVYMKKHTSYEGFKEYYKSLFLIDNSILNWTTHRTAGSYRDLCSDVLDILNNKAINSTSSREECIAYAKKCYPSLLKKISKLHLECVEDLKSLHKIDEWFNDDLESLKKQIKGL